MNESNKYPRGKLNEHDEGQTSMAIAADNKKGVVIVQFFKPIAWLGLPKQQALELSELLKSKANELIDA